MRLNCTLFTGPEELVSSSKKFMLCVGPLKRLHCAALTVNCGSLCRSKTNHVVHIFSEKVLRKWLILSLNHFNMLHIYMYMPVL